VPDDIDLMLLCDDGAPVVCDDIDLCAGPASDCTYAAGDPINLRDPWGLTPTDTPVAAKSRRCWDDGKVCLEIELDDQGCEIGPTGDACRASKTGDPADPGGGGAGGAEVPGEDLAGAPKGVPEQDDDVVFANKRPPRGGRRPVGRTPSQAAEHQRRLDEIRMLESFINRYRDPADPYRYQPPPVIHSPGSSPYSMQDIWRLNAVLEQQMRAGPHPNSAMGRLQAATAPAPSITDVLRPGGRLIGEAGTSAQIRILKGGSAEAQALFGQISQGGSVVDETSYPGTLVMLPGGGQVGYRPTSRSGPPTIDVVVEGLGIREIKFLP
ncbi:MAG TPA: hypothetical protein VJ787_07560, partial [Thermoleophilia bacterium]|nr:hypothetical protein [Thermoleophilia bacterium]